MFYSVSRVHKLSSKVEEICQVVSHWYFIQCFSFILFSCWEQNINMKYWWIIRAPILAAVMVILASSSSSLCVFASCYAMSFF